MTATNTKQIAILIENDVEDVEFQIPYNALRNVEAEVVVLGSRTNETYKGKQGKVSIKADATTTEARAEDFDAVIIPGGMAPDKMRTNMKTVRFVQDAFRQNKLVAAVCHGPQVLIEGDLLRGKRATGFRAIRKDMQNAGADYVDQPLVEDGNLLTSRHPGDLPIFTTAILRRLGLSLGIKGVSLPDEGDRTAEWWKLGEQWGGSSKSEIASAINTAIRGERYAAEAFENYADKASDPELRGVFREIQSTKLRHIQMLEGRLAELGEKESFQAAASGAYATLKGWFQSSDDVAVLQRALGDLQTGVNDAWYSSIQYTDPTTSMILDEIATDTAKHETRVEELYEARQKPGEAKAAAPTTGTAVKTS